MINRKQINERISALRDEIAALLSSTDGDGCPTSEQLTEAEEKQTKLDALVATVSAADRLDGAGRALEQSAGRAAPALDPDGGEPLGFGDVSVGEHRAARTYGFEDIAEYGMAVREACRSGGSFDDRLRGPHAAPGVTMTETIGEDGGFAVPPQFREEIWGVTFNENSLLAQFPIEPTESNSVTVTKDENAPWGTTGVQAYWDAEKAQIDPSKHNLKQSEMRLQRLNALVLASEELIEDAPRLASRLTTGAGNALSWAMIDAFVNGTGAGQPLGYINSSALVTVAKESGQSADTIVVANLAKMVGSLIFSGASRPLWVANPDTLPQLLTLTIGDTPVFTPLNTGVRGQIAGTLMGWPIFFSETAQTLGDAGDIHLVDPAGYYAVSKRGGIKAANSMHLFFDYNLVAFRWTIRVNGQPFLSSSISANNGSLAKSHFAIIAART